MTDGTGQVKACAGCARTRGEAASAVGRPFLLSGEPIDRRFFLSAAALASVTALLAACGNPLGPGGNGSLAWGGPLSIKLSSYPALSAVGGMARVDGGNGSPTALVRTGATSFAGLSMICTHQGGTIALTGSGFFCPNHGATFSKDGSWIGGQPTTSLYSMPVAYDAAAGTATINRPA